MRFVFDEPKRRANIAKHGFDIAEFEAAFSFDRFFNIAAQPSHTGRTRFKLIGMWHDRIVFVAIVSPLGSEAIAVVSVRRADRKERAFYGQA